MTDFGPDRSRPSGRFPYCRPCARDAQKAATKIRAGKKKEYDREYYRSGRRPRYKQDPAKTRALNLRRYGLSVEEYEQKLADQKGQCDICQTHYSERNKRLAVDHDHDSGRVRGLLCGPCNHGIGLLKDSPELLKKAAQYLEKYRA